MSPRGAERVLKEFCRFSGLLSLYVLFLSPGRIDPLIKRHVVFASTLSRLPGVERYYRYLLPLFPRAVERLRVRNADLLLSISHSVAKGISRDPDIPHVCYCLTPMRYLWRTELYGEELRSSWQGLCLKLVSGRLKKWDVETSPRVDHFVAISRTVAERIRSVYNRQAEVIYPCVDLDTFEPRNAPREEFYLMASALVPHKRVELAVEAFNRLGRPLWIVGNGPLSSRLKRRARRNVRFMGWLPDPELRDLYCRARALIFPGVEDFGLVPVEAQACGCPVIALGEGGATETVREGETGLFFDEPSPESLLQRVHDFERSRFDPRRAVEHARRFSRRRFFAEWRSYLSERRLAPVFDSVDV